MKTARIFLASITLIFNAYSLLFADKNFVTLDKVSVNDNSVVVSLSGETKYHAFKIENPPRIIIEFTNTELNLKQKNIEVDGKTIKRIRGGQFQNDPVKIARVVLDMNSMAEYQLNGKGTRVTLTLNPGDSTTTSTAGKSDLAENKKQEEPVKAATIAATPKTTVAPRSTMAKPVESAPASINSQREAAASNMKIQLPKKLVTLDFQDADIRDILRILSIKSGINIIYASDVTGTVSIHLEDVPFDKAFETILAIRGLVSQVQGPNILRVATPQKIADERSQAVTFTKIFPLNYAKAEEVKLNLDSIRNAEGRKGNISIDARTNSLVVTDTPDGLISVEQVISELDLKPPQVIIEAKLIEVILTDNFDLGIQWQYASSAYNERNVSIAIGGTEASTGDSSMGTGATVGGSVIRPLTTAEGGTGVSLNASPVEGQIGSIAFGIMIDNNVLTGILSALSQKGLSKILSNPRVTTINNQAAKILIGQRVPFQTTTVSNGVSQASTQWQDVGIKLDVVPTINTDQRVTLKIKPEVSLVTALSAAGPIIASRQADTTVMVKNGETIVIGGLIREEDRKLGTQVPLLGELPIIGHLFRRDVNTKERSELLVFITPQIID
ncbi:MAG: hypothetical protein A2219_01695 [Elusimicrobia bacterium RIFOXYA2_FULL_50_26]|nr:MAG: hypothetical protein A2219_01695 [Elusimicrobia bacterium RIFOXYA2_FULL_50_26]OGS24123.1 MAG: hypothetical protein A2314_09415 [Elusimicrobia bacterium RIFOXYB2_FULL_50_12]